MALGVLTFALLTLLALLPLGVKSNQVSAEETRAVNILSMLEADLRNTHPLAHGGKSAFFGFTLPYAADGAGRLILNPALTVTTALSPENSCGLDEAEMPMALAGRPRFQASVLVTQLPDGPTGNVLARLIVNWPGLEGTLPAEVTESSQISGSVETLVSFSAP